VTVQDPRAGTAEPIGATALYCYGVVWAASARGQAAGLGGAPVRGVRFDDVAALTSAIASGRVRARRRDVLRHSEVLTAALAEGTVLPLRFGTVFDSEEAIVSDFLEPRHDELTALLREFDGRVELTVKAFFREESILGEIVRENPRVARLREATRSGADAATYGLRIELGEVVAGELQARARRDAEAILDRLRPLALDVAVEEEPIEHQVLRASFLVERERVGPFDQAMDELARQQAERMHFKYLGPLPPHSFVAVERP
jgi:Gas vesicle synthesis protein GvpL/GvpF